MRFTLNISLLALFLFIGTTVLAQKPVPRLSDQAEFSLVTCTPGDQIYNAYGHSAIRLNDPQLRLDFVYNYGTFNFETPSFVMKFVQLNIVH